MAMLLVLALVLGCGREPPEPYVPPAPWQGTEAPSPADEAVTESEAAQPLRSVLHDGEVTVQATLDGQRVSMSLPLEMGVLRASHLPTLDRAQGFIKADAAALAVAVDRPGAAQTELAAAIVAKVLSGRDGPIQLFFELDTLDHLPALLEGEAEVMVTAIGGLQIGDRRDTITTELAFALDAEQRVHVRTVQPVRVDLDAFQRAGGLASLPGVRRASPEVEVGVRARFKDAGDAPLPDFLRTAVIVRTVEEVRKDHRSLTDRYQTVREGAEERGAPPKLYDHVDRATFKEIDEELRRREAKRAREAQRLMGQ